MSNTTNRKGWPPGFTPFPTSAIRKTLKYCQEHSKPVPEWLALADLVNMSNSDSRKTGDLILGRGQVVVTLRWLASRWNWDKDRVRRFLIRLEEASATREPLPERRGTFLDLWPLFAAKDATPLNIELSGIKDGGDMISATQDNEYATPLNDDYPAETDPDDNEECAVFNRYLEKTKSSYGAPGASEVAPLVPPEITSKDIAEVGRLLELSTGRNWWRGCSEEKRAALAQRSLQEWWEVWPGDHQTVAKCIELAMIGELRDEYKIYEEELERNNNRCDQVLRERLSSRLFDGSNFDDDVFCTDEGLRAIYMIKDNGGHAADAPRAAGDIPIWGALQSRVSYAVICRRFPDPLTYTDKDEKYDGIIDRLTAEALADVGEHSSPGITPRAVKNIELAMTPDFDPAGEELQADPDRALILRLRGIYETWERKREELARVDKEIEGMELNELRIMDEDLCYQQV